MLLAHPEVSMCLTVHWNPLLTSSVSGLNKKRVDSVEIHYWLHQCQDWTKRELTVCWNPLLTSSVSGLNKKRVDSVEIHYWLHQCQDWTKRELTVLKSITDFISVRTEQKESWQCWNPLLTSSVSGLNKKRVDSVEIHYWLHQCQDWTKRELTVCWNQLLTSSVSVLKKKKKKASWQYIEKPDTDFISVRTEQKEIALPTCLVIFIMANFQFCRVLKL